jgi:hypothetical protein
LLPHAHKILIALLLTSLTACIGKKPTCENSHNENFEHFFSHWITDKSFSLERTKYPLKQVKYADDDEHTFEQIDFISKADIAGQPTLSVYENKHGLTHTIKPQNKKLTIVSIFKPDTDWLYEYVFIKSKQCWFLEEVHDYSL